MPDSVDHMKPADPDAVRNALSYALRYEGRRRAHHTDRTMARMTAAQPLEHLTAAGLW
jgi:hypothetical protein